MPREASARKYLRRVAAPGNGCTDVHPHAWGSIYSLVCEELCDRHGARTITLFNVDEVERRGRRTRRTSHKERRVSEANRMLGTESTRVHTTRVAHAGGREEMGASTVTSTSSGKGENRDGVGWGRWRVAASWAGEGGKIEIRRSRAQMLGGRCV